MATEFIFNNKVAKLAGVYSRIKSGVKNPPKDLDYGKVLIIDTGLGANFGFGSGIIGSLSGGADAIYSGMDDIEVFRVAMHGGILWKLGEPLFQPDGAQSIGVSEIIYARAATTVAAEIDMTGLTNGGFTIQMRNEGFVGNGVENGTPAVLRKGFAATLSAGTVDLAKFILTIWRGMFRGTDTNNGQSWDNIDEANALPEVMAKSPEVTNVSELVTWMTNNADFNVLFKLKAGSTATGAVEAGDLVTFAGNTLAAGGTETYAPARIDEILDEVEDFDYSIILADKYGADADHLNNTKIQTHISTEARFEKMVVIGGGYDKNDIAANSIAKAATLDADNTIIVHGGVKIADQKMALGFKTYGSIYKAALVVGRLAGLPPQVPLTFKKLKMSGEVHKLNKKEQKECLDAGVLYTVYDADFGGIVVGQGINTLQNNENFINEDATSFSIQVKRIAAQLNKEIEVNAKKQLLGDPNGVNINTLSAQVIKDWLGNYLKGKIAKPTADNLIISYESSSISVTKVQDAYKITYAFKPNTEITKLFFTGFMLS